MDTLFRVEVISKTPNPQQTIYSAMRQDYSEGFVYDAVLPTEKESGDLVIKHLLNGGRGHFGPIEHPQIVFNVGWFPHSVMQQIRTHRVGISMDVQSGRYTGKRVFDLGEELIQNNGNSFWDTDSAIKIDPILLSAIEDVFYLRPPGNYTDRQGKSYEYTESKRLDHLCKIANAAIGYHIDIQCGLSEEHARGLLPFDIRQNWVLSCNARSLMHLLDLRAKSDAQLECQWLCDLIWPHFESWVPEVATWYRKNRWAKAKLAP